MDDGFFSSGGGPLLGGEDEGHDEAVQTQDLGEDQDQDHAHEEPGLLGRTPHARVPHDADGEARGQAAEAHAEAGPQVEEAPGGRSKQGPYVRG